MAHGGLIFVILFRGLCPHRPLALFKCNRLPELVSESMRKILKWICIDYKDAEPSSA
jgi:hypothetical protein